MLKNETKARPDDAGVTYRYLPVCVCVCGCMCVCMYVMCVSRAGSEMLLNDGRPNGELLLATGTLQVPGGGWDSGPVGGSGPLLAHAWTCAARRSDAGPRPRGRERRLCLACAWLDVSGHRRVCTELSIFSATHTGQQQLGLPELARGSGAGRPLLHDEEPGGAPGGGEQGQGAGPGPRLLCSVPLGLHGLARCFRHKVKAALALGARDTAHHCPPAPLCAPAPSPAPTCPASPQVLESMGYSAAEEFPVYADRMPIQLLAYLRLSRVADPALLAKVGAAGGGWRGWGCREGVGCSNPKWTDSQGVQGVGGGCRDGRRESAGAADCDDRPGVSLSLKPRCRVADTCSQTAGLLMLLVMAGKCVTGSRRCCVCGRDGVGPNRRRPRRGRRAVQAA